MSELEELSRQFNAITRPDVAEHEPLPLGISYGVSPERYHQKVLGVASKSALDELRRSPAHYRAWLARDNKPTAAQQFGTMLHALVFEPERFASAYRVQPYYGDGRTKEVKQAKAQWAKDNAGRLPITEEQDRNLLGMQAALMRHKTASRLILACDAYEATLSWSDPEYDVRCKARPDGFSRSKAFALDLKSADDASPEGFAKAIANYGYHRQEAHYGAGLTACGAPADKFWFIAVESEYPHGVGVYDLDAEAQFKGYAGVRQGIERMAECMRDEQWNAYSDEGVTLSLPAWAA